MAVWAPSPLAFSSWWNVPLVPHYAAPHDVADEARDSSGEWTSGGGDVPTTPPREGMHHFTEQEREALKARKIVIPPAWTNVQVTDDPTSDLQVIGKDSKGRSQYVYSADHTERQAAAKFERIKAFRGVIDKLDEALENDAKTDDTAAAVLLMRKMGMRPGSESDTKAAVAAHGATNLRVGDVKVTPTGRMKLDFTGKDGVHIQLPVTDPYIKEVISSRLDGKSKKDRLFATNEGRAAAYLKSVAPQHKLKDMRTYHANDVAARVASKMRAPKNKTEFAKARNKVGDAVAAELGNTRTMALNSYINPAVFSDWREKAGMVKAAGMTTWVQPIVPVVIENVSPRHPWVCAAIPSVTADVSEEPRASDGKWTSGPGGSSGDDAEYQKHIDYVQRKIDEAMKSGNTSDKTETINGDGVTYKPERRKLHDEIINDIWKEKDVDNLPREGKAVISGGLGGAGKSTILGKHAGIDSSKWLTVNPDDIKERMAAKGMIPKIEGLSPMESAPLVHEESSTIAKQLAARAMMKKTNLIHDITMSSRGSVDKRIKDLRKAGYGNIGGVFVDIPVETSVERALARHQRGEQKYKDGKGYGGRFVPPSLIRAQKGAHVSSKNREVFDDLRNQFDEYGLWDNSGASPKKIDGTGRWADDT